MSDQQPDQYLATYEQSGKKICSIGSFYGSIDPGDRVLIVEGFDEVAIYDNDGQYSGTVKELKWYALSIDQLAAPNTYVFNDWYKVGMLKIVAVGIAVSEQPNGKFIVAYQDIVRKDILGEIPF